MTSYTRHFAMDHGALNAVIAAATKELGAVRARADQLASVARERQAALDVAQVKARAAASALECLERGLARLQEQAEPTAQPQETADDQHP